MLLLLFVPPYFRRFVVLTSGSSIDLADLAGYGRKMAPNFAGILCEV
jgi:hypothetical protein